MSDIWERPQLLLNSPANTSNSNNFSRNNWRDIGEEYSQQKVERESNVEKWSFTLPDSQFMALNKAVANNDITVDEGYRLAASIVLSQQYDIPADYIRENFDQILTALNGPAEGYRMGQTAFNFIVNKFRNGLRTMELGMLGNDLFVAEAMGNKQQIESINNKIIKIEEEAYYNSDPNERDHNFFIKALGAAAESTPFTAYIAGAAFFGSLLAPGVGTAAGFAASMNITRGQEYRALRTAGADINTAKNVSLVSGAIQAGLEVFLGNALSIAGGAAKTAGRSLLTENATRVLIEKATANAFKNAHGAGLFLKTALHVGAGYAGEIFEEGLEELLQEWTSALALEAANALQEGGVDTYTAEEILKNMTEAFKGGAMASIFLGIPGTGMNARASIRSWQHVKTEAERPQSEQEFINNTNDSEIFAGLSGEKRLEYQKAVYAEGQQRVQHEESRLTEELRETAGLGTGYAAPGTNPETGEVIPLGETYRRNNGRLYAELDEKANIFKIGDPRVEGRRNLYSHIAYALDNGRILVNEFRVRNDLDTPEFRREAFSSFAEAFAGQEIIWDVKTTREAEIREELIQNNPRGNSAGLNYYFEADTRDINGARYRNRVIENFRAYFPRMSNTEHAIMAAEWEHFAGLQGLPLDEYINKNFGSLDKAFTHDANTDIQAASMEGQKIKGGVTFENTAQDARAIIYLSKNSDLTTFIHEMGHIYRRRLQGDMLKQAEMLWGVKDGKWTREQEERFTEDLERWRRDGAAPTEEMKTFFEKFARFLKEIINAISQREKVSPEIKEFFDKLYTGENSQNTRKAYGGNEAAQGSKDTAGGEKTAQEASRERQRGISEDEYIKSFPDENQKAYFENKTLNAARGDIGKYKGKNTNKVRQTGVTTAKELRDKAEKHIDELRAWVNAIADKYGAKIIERPVDEQNPLPLKTVEGIQRKLDEGNDITQILDVMGMTIVAKDFKSLVDIAAEMTRRDDVVRIKDRYKDQNVKDFGYRDILTNVELSDGMIAEVQINVEQMLSAKSELGGHKYYEIADRELVKAVEEKIITEEQGKIDKDILAEMSSELYDKAYQAVMSEMNFNTDSLDIPIPSRRSMSTTFNREGDKVLSLFTLKICHDFGISAYNSSVHTTPSMSQNFKSGSSNDGTSTFETGVDKLSTDFAEEETTESLNISVPSTNIIDKKINSVNSSLEKNSIDTSGVKANREKYQAADKEYGDEDVININGEEVTVRYVVMEAETPTASHNEDTFNETEGFPKIKGKNANTRKYKEDVDAQRAVIDTGSDYDSRALDELPIITTDGFIISGARRTLGSKLAAKNNTDTKYLKSFPRKAKRAGLNEEQLQRFKHPRLLMEIEINGNYNASLFHVFNQDGRKADDPVEEAVRMSMLIEDSTVKSIADIIDKHETINELYKDKQSLTEIFNILKTSKLIGDQETPRYFTEQGGISGAGEDLLENTLLGATLSEDNIRKLSDSKGLRKKLARALPQLVENRSMGEYSVIPEVNEAVRIAVEVDRNSKTFKNVMEWAAQQGFDFVEQSNQTAIELARKLESEGQSGFADMMAGLNFVLKDAASGQGDLLSAGIDSKENIIRRYLGIKAEIDQIREANNKIINSKTADTLDKVTAAMENAGLARDEAGGTFFQIIGEQGAVALDKAEESTHRLDNLQIAKNMELNGKHPNPIRRATGWERGADGLWRYEIPDLAIINEGLQQIKKNGVIKLSELIVSDELFNAYPEYQEQGTFSRQLKNYLVLLTESEGVASFNPSTQEIKIDRYNFKYKNRGGLKKTLIHEIQHAIQDIEGFAEGGSPQSATNILNKLSEQYFHKIKTSEQIEIYKKWYNAYMQYTQAKDQYGDNHYYANNYKNILNKETVEFKKIVGENGLSLISSYINKKRFDNISNYDLYHRLAGEVEARNAEARTELTSTRRMNTMFANTEDVAREDQMFIKNGLQIAQMAEMEELHEQEKQNYTNKINEYKEGALNFGTLITVGSAPEAYIKNGLPDKTIKLPASVIKKAIEKHHVKIETIENLHELINSPVILMYSISENAVPNAFITLIDAADKNNAPIIVTHNPTRGEITSITSVYGKENLGSLVRRTHERGKIIAVDKNKVTKYLRPNELQLLKGSAPNDLSQVSSNPNQMSSENNTLFQLEDELLEDASQYENWRDYRDSVEPGEPNDADNAWYRSFWNDSRKIYSNTLFQDEKKASRSQELDNRFYKEADKKNLTEILKELYRIHNDQTLKPTEEESGSTREEYSRIKRLQRRINTELPNAGSIIGIAAQVKSGRELSSTQYDRLKTWMRKNKRDYRSVFADIMKQEEFLEDLADEKDGEPAGRLANPHPEKWDIKSRLKEIAKIIRETDSTLAREIENGGISYDDPRITAFETGVDSQYKEAKATLDAIEKEIAEDYARLANNAQKRIVTAYENMIKLREQKQVTDEKIQRMMDEEGKIAEPYFKQQRLEKASYEQALKTYEDLIRTLGNDANVREAVARREAMYAERERQKGIMRRQRAARTLREIKQKLVKRITRNVSFNTVSYDKAVIIKTIQRLFEVSVFEGVNKWIGPEDRKSLREAWSQWSTDEEFRQALTDKIQEKYKKRKNGSELELRRIIEILNKPWSKISIADKKALFKLLPETNFYKELGIAELSEENRESIQLDIEERSIDGEIKLILGENLRKKIVDNLGEELFNRVQNKPLTEWSIFEAEELARVIDILTVEGKKELAAKKEAMRVLEEEYRGKILDALENTGIVINPDDSPEEKEKKKNERDRILKKYAEGKKNTFINNFFDGNLRRFTTAMDGGRKGVFTNLLYWAENDAFNQEQKQIAARRLKIDNVMKENNIKLDELYKKVEIKGLEGSDLYRMGGKLTVDDLLYIKRGYLNNDTRNAIMYGNLSNATERAQFSGSQEDIEAFSNISHGRMMLVMSHIKEFFNKPENKKYLALYNAIGDDYDNNGERLNKACIDMFNKPMWRVENYVPMNRREQSGDENENRIIEDLLGITSAGMKWVNRGFTEKRIKIKPGGQKPIELGLYKTWTGSVTSTEHLLAYGPLVQTLNSVFKGFHAAEVRQVVRDRWGKSAVDRLDNTIAEFANPNATKQRSDLDKFIRALRGKTSTAYLAYRTSSILLQGVTSPWPYLQEVSPLHYIPACLEVAGGFGKINELIRQKSIFMNTRQFDPMIKIIKEQIENSNNPIIGKINKFNNLGMKGLEWIDWAAVAPGWLAKYRSELANVAKEQEAKYQELLKKYQSSEYADVLPTLESKINKALSEVMNDERQDAEAVARADDMVRRLQPSSRNTDIAPIFKNRNEIVSAVLQFQVSLNVIWQNLRYDIPLAIKEKQLGTLVGMITGYALAGICLGFLHDDEDDEEKHDRDWTTWMLYNALTQFTDSVPVIGSLVNTTSEQVLTGKSKYWGTSGMFPSIEKALTGTTVLASAVRENDPDKQKNKYLNASAKFAEAIGISLGVSVSGTKELLYALGIGDGDGHMELYLKALMGHRK